jgi:hypothetical protein
VPRVTLRQLRPSALIFTPMDMEKRPIAFRGHDPCRSADEISALPLMSCGGPTHPVRQAILVRAPRVPVATGTHGEPRTTTVRISLTVHDETSLLTVGYGPDLCTAGVKVWSSTAQLPDHESLPGGTLAVRRMVSKSARLALHRQRSAPGVGRIGLSHPLSVVRW